MRFAMQESVETLDRAFCPARSIAPGRDNWEGISAMDQMQIEYMYAPASDILMNV